jgi:hypothetical protein
MPDVRGTALLPNGEANGLAAIAAELLRDPRKYRAALVVFDCKRGTQDYDLDDTVLTVRIRRAEVLLPADLGEVEKLMRRALEARTGLQVLPLELEDEIADLFREMTAPDSPEEPADGEQPEDGEPGDAPGPWPGDEDGDGNDNDGKP